MTHSGPGGGALGRPPGHPALAPFGTTIFAEMSALAAAHRRDQPGPGLPRHRRSAGGARGRGRGDPRRAQPVPAGPRHPRAARRDRRAPAAVLRARRRPGHRGAGHRRRHRGDRRDRARAVRAGRRGGRRSSRTTTRTPPRSRWPARSRRTSALRFPDFAVDEDALRAAFSPRTRLVLLNSPHNPTGKVFTRAELELVCALAREHDAWVVTDEVYEHLVFDGAEHVPLATLPGMRGAHAHDLVGRQDVLGDRVEGRLGVRPGRAGGGGAHGQAVPHLRRVGARSSRRSRPGSACPMPSTPGWRRRCAAKRDRLVEGLGRAGLRCRSRRGTYFVVADAAPLGCDRRARVLPRAARLGPGWSRCRCRCSTTTSTRHARSCGSRSASATTCSTRRSAAGGPAGLTGSCRSSARRPQDGSRPRLVHRFVPPVPPGCRRWRGFGMARSHCSGSSSPWPSGATAVGAGWCWCRRRPATRAGPHGPDVVGLWPAAGVARDRPFSAGEPRPAGVRTGDRARWRWPLRPRPPVLRPFRAPLSTYGAGPPWPRPRRRRWRAGARGRGRRGDPCGGGGRSGHRHGGARRRPEQHLRAGRPGGGRR